MAEQKAKKNRRKTATRRRVRRRVALAAEFERFMAEIPVAIAACVIARRWSDLEPIIQNYARQLGVLDPNRVFQGALCHRLVRHALTISAAAPADFDQVLRAIASTARAAQSGQSLSAAVAEHRADLEHPEAVDGFRGIQRAGSRSRVH